MYLTLAQNTRACATICVTSQPPVVPEPQPGSVYQQSRHLRPHRGLCVGPVSPQAARVHSPLRWSVCSDQAHTWPNLDPEAPALQPQLRRSGERSPPARSPESPSRCPSSSPWTRAPFAHRWPRRRALTSGLTPRSLLGSQLSRPTPTRELVSSPSSWFSLALGWGHWAWPGEQRGKHRDMCLCEAHGEGGTYSLVSPYICASSHCSFHLPVSGP